MGNRTIVIKMNGAGRLRQVSEEMPWNQGRQSIDEDGLIDLVAAISGLLNEGWTVLVVPGGTGGHLYIDTARRLGLDERTLRQIGMHCVDATGLLLLSLLNTRIPHARPVFAELHDLGADTVSKVKVLRASHAATSSDHLAVLVADQATPELLVFLKNGVPKFYSGFPQPTILREILVDDLRDRAKGIAASPGRHYLLDREAINALRSLQSPVVFVNPRDVARLRDLAGGEKVEDVTWITRRQDVG